jgi:heme exporter protein D
MVLGTAMYAVVFVIVAQNDLMAYVSEILTIVGVWNGLLILATVISIVDSILSVRAKKTRQLATDAMVVKLASIPFFLLNYVGVAMLILGGAVFLLLADPLFLFAGVIGVVLTYLAMLSTSVYVWAAIVQLRRERIIGTGLTVLYGILSLVFVTDIVAGVMLFGHYRKRPRLAVVCVLLSAGLMTIAIAIVGHIASFNAVNADYADSGPDPLLLVWIGVGISGAAAIVITLIVSVVRRSALRDEAQRAAATKALATPGKVSDEALAR